VLRRDTQNLVLPQARFAHNLTSVTSDAFARGVDKIAKLASAPGDLVSLWRASTEVLADVVPHYWTPCFYTFDPASILITSHFHEGIDEFPPEALLREYSGTTSTTCAASPPRSPGSPPCTK
jgi:hypothetical protein